MKVRVRGNGKFSKYKKKRKKIQNSIPNYIYINATS
jgi:hypothetical protein